MKAVRPHTAIHTIDSQLRARRRLDLIRRAVNHTLGDMRAGATLHLACECGREWWTLSTGARVSPDIAAILITHPDIQGIGDALFGDVRCQTWRVIDSPRGE